MHPRAASCVSLVVETDAFEGVRRAAGKVAVDFGRVTGTLPAVVTGLPDDESVPVVVATLGRSPLVEELRQRGAFDPAAIAGKREVFQIAWVALGDDDERQALLVVGSDKRGTIYGAFALSEYLGVSPLHFWGDAEPQRQPDATLGDDVEQVSKEPSVRYRGFFINDEWPCFGTWTHRRFGGFTAEMYDHVFELLLRLRGNYLWPAMWTSSFAVDGPGGLSEELADLYGVVVGTSHHEPCLRASEEWDLFSGDDTAYGSKWNYAANADGLTRFWADGLERSGTFEKIVTIGMRGERDSALLGEDSPIKDNVDLLKEVITTQRELCAQHAPGLPQMIALYKEVEDYFYGSADVEGLIEWDGLDDVILMLCDDNFGFVRSLPSLPIADRRFGLYYHFDYHGGPTSYEWMPSTPLAKVWEQVGKAYEFGIRDVWVVNVGDLKFNEVTLAYFMALAYDMDTHGAHNPSSPRQWTESWTAATFPSADAGTRRQIAEVLTGFVRLNALRRPEAVNAGTYHPAHHLEADRILAQAQQIDDLNEAVYATLRGSGAVQYDVDGRRYVYDSMHGGERDAYYSMVYLPAKASINLLRMHLYAAKNHHFARQGKKVANEYADLVTECIETDRRLMSDFTKFAGGKWKGMELEEHVGFTQWNDFANRYPLRALVEPVHRSRLVVSRKDSAAIYHKVYGPPMVVTVDDFRDAGVEEVVVEVASDGVGPLRYAVEAADLPEWLTVSPESGTVDGQAEITLRCDRDRLGPGVQTARLAVTDGDTTVDIAVSAERPEAAQVPPMTFFARRGVVVMEANHAAVATSAGSARFVELADYGRSGAGMTVRPVTAHFAEAGDKPSLTYRIVAPRPAARPGPAGDTEYVVELWTTPVNPVSAHTPLRLMLTSGGQTQVLATVPADFTAFHTDERWCQGVVDNVRVTTTTLRLADGVNELTVAPLEPGLVLERVLVYAPGNAPAPSYLGPKETHLVR